MLNYWSYYLIIYITYALIVTEKHWLCTFREDNVELYSRLMIENPSFGKEPMLVKSTMSYRTDDMYINIKKCP